MCPKLSHTYAHTYTRTLYYHVSKSYTKYMRTYTPASDWFTYTILCLSHTNTHTVSLCGVHIHPYTHIYCITDTHVYTCTLYYSVFDSNAHMCTYINVCTPYCSIHTHNLLMYVSFYFASSAYTYTHTSLRI